MQLKTIGHNHYPGYEFPVSITKDITKLQQNEGAQYYKIVFLERKHTQLRLNGEQLSLLGTYLICLNEKDRVEFINEKEMEGVQVLFFQPKVFSESLTFEVCNKEEGLSMVESQDSYYFYRFRWNTKIEQKVLFLDEFVQGVIKQKFLAVYDFLNNQETGLWPCMSRTNILEILFCLARLEDSKKEDYVVDTHSELTANIIAYLQLHYKEKITLEGLAALFGTNRTTLNEEFKKTTGKSLNKYLQQMRVQIAAALLKNTLIPISEICQRTGFYDISYFSKTFKKQAGYTPAEYRKNYNKVS